MTREELITAIEWPLLQAETRARLIHADEDAEIEMLCKRLGYGAVMDAVMRLWLRADPVGAFIIGGCAGTYRNTIERARAQVPE
jgi:hypothetical protein